MSTKHHQPIAQADLTDIPASDLLDRLEPSFPLLAEMASTPQDPEWHSEGDVRVHTCMVIDEMRKILATHPDAEDLDLDSRRALILGAALHDIGKCITTREARIGGRIRITSPRHATRGRSYVAPRLPTLNLSRQANELILIIVGHHHDPRKLQSRSTHRSKYWRFSRVTNARLIYLFEIADNLGRINRSGPQEALDLIELFRLSCEEHRVWDDPCPYREWDDHIRQALVGEQPDVIDFVTGEARRWYEAKEIATPFEALARSHEHRNGSCELIVACGPSSSGKSRWIDERLSDFHRISLDEIREEICGRRDRMKHEGKVLQLARERLRECLRRKQNVVWDATSVRENGRAALLSLGHAYHARTRIVAFATPPDELHRRNKTRQHSIPTTAIERQLESLEWPYLWEAHKMDTVDYR